MDGSVLLTQVIGPALVQAEQALSRALAHITAEELVRNAEKLPTTQVCSPDGAPTSS